MADTYSRLLYHLVFATRGRQPLIVGELREQLYGYIGGIIRREGGTMLEIGGMEDHVHMLLALRPRQAMSTCVKKIKGGSSRWVNEHGDGAFAWQVGYAVFTVSGAQIDRVRRYIRLQHQHHRQWGFEQELEALCKPVCILASADE